MSFSVGASGKKSEVADALADRFAEVYSDPAPGVTTLASVGIDAVNSFCSSSKDEGNFSVAVAGHAKQNDEDRDSLSISINPIS